MHFERKVNGLGIALAVHLAGALYAQNVSQYSASVTGTNASVCVTENTIKGSHHRCALVVTITKQSTPAFQHITLPIDFETITALRVTPRSHLVALGKLPGGYEKFVIYDILTRQLIFTDLSYSPALSPDGNWVAYQRFIPPHGMESLSVDIKFSPVDTQLLNKSRDLSVFRDSGAWLMDNLHWSPDGKWLLFGTTNRTDDNLVLVNANSLGASTLSLSQSTLCANNEMREDQRKCKVSILHVTFPSLSTNSIRVTFKRFGARGYDEKSVTYTEEEFIPVGPKQTTK